jgi:hypothetical protein
LRGAFQPKQSFNFQGIASLRNARNDTIQINLNEYTISLGCTLKRNSLKGFYHALLIWIDDANGHINEFFLLCQAD